MTQLNKDKFPRPSAEFILESTTEPTVAVYRASKIISNWKSPKDCRASKTISRIFLGQGIQFSNQFGCEEFGMSSSSDPLMNYI